MRVCNPEVHTPVTISMPTSNLTQQHPHADLRHFDDKGRTDSCLAAEALAVQGGLIWVHRSQSHVQDSLADWLMACMHASAPVRAGTHTHTHKHTHTHTYLPRVTRVHQTPHALAPLQMDERTLTDARTRTCTPMNIHPPHTHTHTQSNSRVFATSVKVQHWRQQPLRN